MILQSDPEQNSHNILAGRYLIGELLAEGGHGRVCLGRDTETDQVVVIKQLKEEWRDYPELVARFVREGEVLRQLNHPNIVQMLAAVEQDGRYSIVMEYMEGGSLRDILKQTSNLPEHRCVAIALELADALSRAHHLGILHRDLKPGNVLLAADGTPRLTDFGLSRLPQKSARSNLTPTGSIMGTPSYMSPEALLGEPLDARSDIWSFGVLLYELLTGERPFQAETITSLMMCIVNDPLPPIEQLRPGVSPALSQLLTQLLAKKPDDRINSMRQVAVYLEGIQKGRPLNVVIEQTMTMSTTFVTQTEIVDASKVEIRHNLPAQPTPFIGREAELAALDELMADNRLVTIIGPGGMGKTRLSLAFGERIISGGAGSRMTPTHGVYFVPLAPLSEPDHIVSALAEALDFPLDSGGQRRSAKQQILDYLGQKEMLLVLDNFEHLLDGVELVADIFQAAPEVKVLASSRERLHLHGEQVYSIQGLEFPDWETPEDAEQYTAVKLFIQSARRVQHDFLLDAEDLTYMTRICRLVGGLPLGIELAAGWVDMLSLEDIASEIQQNLDFLETDTRNVPARHRSMRAVFDGSWNRMSEAEQTIFPQLCVFRGGFTRQAAQAIMDASLRILGKLVNKSLLQYDREQNRYQIHELLRQYAAEHIVESEEELRTKSNHSIYYLGILHDCEAQLKGKRQQTALNQIEIDFENIQIAWHWAAHQGGISQMERAVDSLAIYCRWQGRYKEGRALFSIAMERVKLSPLKVKLLAWLSLFDRTIGEREKSYEQLQEARNWLESTALNEYDMRAEKAFVLLEMVYSTPELNTVEQLLEDSLVLYRQVNDQWGLAHVLEGFGQLIHTTGDLEVIENHLQESLNLRRKLGDRRGSVTVLEMLSSVARQKGQYDQSLSLAQECLDLSQTLHSRLSEAVAMENLGMTLNMHGRFAEGIIWVAKSVEIYADLGNQYRLAIAFNRLSLLQLGEGQIDTSRQNIQKALSIAEEIGVPSLVPICMFTLARTWLVEGVYEKAQILLRHALQIARTTHNQVGLGYLLPNLSIAVFAEGKSSEAKLYAYEGLSEILKGRNAITLVWGYVAICPLLVAAGRPKRALSLYYLLDARLPELSTSYYFKRFREEMAGVAALLADDEVESTQQSARRLEIWSTTETLLHELAELGWQNPQDSVETRAIKLANNLPVQPTPFIGREAELAALDDLLANETNRLVTIVGPGGMGKTRLSLAYADMIVSGRGDTRVASDNGVYFVPLAPLSEPDHIVLAVAEALEFPLDSGGQQRRSAKQQVLDYLHRKRMLLVMDNFEHVLDGVDFVAEILQAAPEIKILASSRERLHLRSEQLYLIQGLEFPDWETPEDAAEYTAVQLFLQAARRNQPDFALRGKEDLTYLARICRIVAGMPLALELAASWVDMLPLSEIATELQQGLDFLETDMRDVPERHRSIRAAIDYSWQKLAEKERAVFAKLSIFRGGFTREAAKAVADAGLRQLARLVNKSFLQTHSESGRYQIHELMRQYGAEKLAESGDEPAVRDLQSVYYCQALYEQLDDLKGGRQQEALHDIESDLENVRMAWQWAAEHQEIGRLVQAMDSLGYFHEWTGRYQIGRDLFELSTAALKEMDTIVALPARAKLLGWQGAFSHIVGDSKTAASLCQQALSLLPSEMDTRLEEAFILYQIGRLESDYEQKKKALKRSLLLQREVNNNWGIANTLQILGDPDILHGTSQEVEHWLEECLTIREKLDDQQGIARTVISLSTLLRYQGRYEQSERLARQAVNICQTLGARSTEARALYNLGQSLNHLAKFEEAKAVLTRTEELFKELENRFWLAITYFALGLNALSRKKLQEARTFSGLFDQTLPVDAFQLANNNLNLILVVEEKFEEALRLLYDNDRHGTSPNSRGYSIYALYVALAEFGCQRLDRAKLFAYRSLQNAITLKIRIEMQHAFIGLIVLFSALGDVERAIELDELSRKDHPLLDKSGNFIAFRRPYRERIAALPVEVVEAARERGRQLDYWQTAEALLQELTEKGWGEAE